MVVIRPCIAGLEATKRWVVVTRTEAIEFAVAIELLTCVEVAGFGGLRVDAIVEVAERIIGVFRGDSTCIVGEGAGAILGITQEVARDIVGVSR
ncbi:MAG: hypothetical protein AAFR81_27985 [Chloroflexota bacterium]